MPKEAESAAEIAVKVGQATTPAETAEVAMDTTEMTKEGVAVILILPTRITEEVEIGMIVMTTSIGVSGKSDADGDAIGTDATILTTNATDATAVGLIGGLHHHRLLPAPLAGAARAEGGGKVMLGAIAMTVMIEGTAVDVATVGITEVGST